MYAWGWECERIWQAARKASARLGHGTELELREVHNGGKRVKFQLRFASPTSRLLKRERVNDAEYRPGVLVRPGRKTIKIIDPIPASEVGGGPRIRKEIIPTRRSCGAPCWHAFGHLFRCMFEINPEGRIKTMRADYRGMEGFEAEFPLTDRNIGSMLYPLQYSDACDCYHYGVEDF